MFKQITTLEGNEWYLIASLWLFLIFFILVGVMLIRMRKDYIDYMGAIPLEESDKEKSEIQNQSQSL
jgi:F420-0:gamma-glutamyl ligase-like protein